MSVEKKYSIRPMTLEEVNDTAVEWAAAEGWNPGLFDSECFYRADPAGFLGGFLGDEAVSCISIVSYGNDFAFLGFYIVKPEYRGRGYGIKIWNAALDRVKGKNIGLDGVIDQQENYRKSGFVWAHNNIRYEGVATPNSTPLPNVEPLSEVAFEDLLQYDQRYFPAPRAEFLKCWIHQPESHALAVRKEGQLAGYSLIRKCRRGYKIGPLFAEHPDLANQLFSASIAFPPPGTPVFLDIPEVNPAAEDLATRNHMKKVFGTARMYNQFQPDLNLNNVYGITTFELG